VSGGTRDGHGIVIDSINVLVRGNQVVFSGLLRGIRTLGTGILTVNNNPIRIEGNQVFGWKRGISGRAGATVSKNQVWHNESGIFATGGSVVGNVATANAVGVFVTGTASASRNASYLNLDGFQTVPPYSGVVTKNNMHGNGICGLRNHGVVGLDATNNYWGVATGPGGPPADSECTDPGSSTDVTPFATKPFTVKVLKP
jgi:hypothetical protein